jgi:hypothetical protein
MPTWFKGIAGVLITASVAGAVDPVLLDKVMPEAKVLAGADLSRSAGVPSWRFLLAQIGSSDRQLEVFTQLTGLDPLKDLREILIASSGEAEDGGSLVLARGSFDLKQVADRAAQSNSVSYSYKGVQVLAGRQPTDGWLAFLDGSTVVLGDVESVRGVVDRRGGNAGPEPKLAAKVRQISRQYDCWLVSTAPALGLLEGIVDPQLRAIMQGPLKMITETSVGIRFGHEVLIEGEALGRSESDASALADVLRLFVGMAQLSGQKDPKVADSVAFLQKLSLKAEGNVLRMSLAISEADLERLLRQSAVNAQHQGIRPVN